MLYNPKWEVKADPFSLRSLIAWLETQPADETYCYMDNGHCLVAQYLESHGYRNLGVDRRGFYYSVGVGRARAWQDLPPVLNDIALRGLHTFGAALERARSL
jgi:hypothetical protein